VLCSIHTVFRIGKVLALFRRVFVCGSFFEHRPLNGRTSLLSAHFDNVRQTLSQLIPLGRIVFFLSFDNKNVRMELQKRQCLTEL
jgi:hypothetical protein